MCRPFPFLTEIKKGRPESASACRENHVFSTSFFVFYAFSYPIHLFLETEKELPHT